MMAFSVQLLRVSACLGGLGGCQVMGMLSLPIFLKIRNSDDIYTYVYIMIYTNDNTHAQMTTHTCVHIYIYIIAY